MQSQVQRGVLPAGAAAGHRVRAEAGLELQQPVPGVSRLAGSVRRAAQVVDGAAGGGQARRPARGDMRVSIAPLVAMGILDLTANGLYALATRHGLLSVVAVAASLYPLITVLLARSLLGERVHRVQEIGIVAALAGVTLIAAG